MRSPSWVFGQDHAEAFPVAVDVGTVDFGFAWMDVEAEEEVEEEEEESDIISSLRSNAKAS